MSSRTWVIVTAFLAPALIGVVLVVIRLRTPVENMPAMEYEAIDFQQSWKNLIEEMALRYDKLKTVEGFAYNVYVPRLIVAYAPNNVEAYKNIIEMAATHLDSIELKAHPDCRRLRESMLTSYYLAGVCFNETIPYMNTESIHPEGAYFNRLDYTLVFPNELRLFRDTYISSHWHTNRLFHPYDKRLNRMEFENDGGYPGYVREGFVPLQNAISMSFIYLVTNQTSEAAIPSVRLCRFPHQAYAKDELSIKLEYCLGTIILSGYIFQMAQLIKHIVTEKADNIYTALTIISIPRWIHYMAWFVYGVLTFTISVSLLLLELTLNFYNDYAVLSKSSFTALLFFFVFYNMATTAFCLMFAAFFSKPVTAVMASSLFWFMSYIPFYTSVYDDQLILSFIMQCFCSNTVLSHALNDILEYENLSDGYGWYDIIYARSDDAFGPVGIYIFMLIGQTAAYLLIGMLAEQLNVGETISNYISRKPPENEVLKNRLGLSLKGSSFYRTELVEVENIANICTVRVENLSKLYNGELIVKDVSLELYQDCVTLLMGHNAAGKKTLLYMIAGLIDPTEGTITIDNSMVIGNKDVSFGIYLGENTLYRDLPVEKQLKFFSRIKGTEIERVNDEVVKYMKAMNLIDKANVRTSDLSAGVRQQLAVCCAFVGGSNIVILDHPTAHMDAVAKKLFWKMIRIEKRFRSILMSSHLPDEVQVVADRLAIMNTGMLKYCGSTVFLRKTYGQSYRLVFVKGSECKPDDVTALIQKYVRYATPMSNICNELTYIISPKYLPVLGELIDEIEEHSIQLDIHSFEICESSLHDIFYLLAAEHPGEGSSHRQTQILNGYTIYAHEYEHNNFMAKQKQCTGCQLWFNQCYAMLLKRFYYTRHLLLFHFIQLSMPVFITILSYAFVSENIDFLQMESIKFSPQQYKSSVTIFEHKGGSAIVAEAAAVFSEAAFQESEAHSIKDVNSDESLLNFLFEIFGRTTGQIQQKMFVGATFDERGIMAWFSNYPLHAAPLALNQAQSALLSAYLDADAGIYVNFHPLPFVVHDRSMTFESSSVVDNVLAVNLVLSFCLIWSTCIVFIIKDRKTRFKLIQFISGCHIFTYWSMMCVFDILRITISSLAIVFTMWWYADRHLNYLITSASQLGILILTGFAMVSFNYILSFVDDDQIDMYCVSVVYNMYGSVAYLSLLHVMNKGFSGIVKGFEWNSFPFYRIYAPFSLSNALIMIFRDGKRELFCDNEVINLISTAYENCQTFPRCCKDSEDRWSWSLDTMADLLVTSTLVITYWLSLFVVEYDIRRKVWHYFRAPSLITAAVTEYEKFSRYTKYTGECMDLANEVKKVMELDRNDYKEKTLICYGVARASNIIEFAQTHRFYLVLEKSELLAVPSVSDNGLSTLFQILVGELEMSEGNIYIKGHHRSAAYKHMGYCPSHDPVLRECTPGEVMRIICLLRGIARSEIDELCISLATVLGFQTHLNKELLICSKGVWRRLSCACALINTPSLLYFDRPTTMIDPAGQRQLWYVLEQMRLTNEATIFYSALKTQECERVCTKIAIFSLGRMIKIGTTRDFAKGKRKHFMLHIKMKKVLGQKPIQNLIYFVQSKFKHSELKDKFGSVLLFTVPYGWNRVSEVFVGVQHRMFVLQIETFRIYPETFSTTSVDIMQRETVLRSSGADKIFESSSGDQKNSSDETDP